MLSLPKRPRTGYWALLKQQTLQNKLFNLKEVLVGRLLSGERCCMLEMLLARDAS